MCVCENEEIMISKKSKNVYVNRARDYSIYSCMAVCIYSAWPLSVFVSLLYLFFYFFVIGDKDYAEGGEISPISRVGYKLVLTTHGGQVSNNFQCVKCEVWRVEK